MMWVSFKLVNYQSFITTLTNISFYYLWHYCAVTVTVTIINRNSATIPVFALHACYIHIYLNILQQCVSIYALNTVTLEYCLTRRPGHQHHDHTTQSHYPDTELTTPILIMPSARLGSDRHTFCNSLESNSRPSTMEACALPTWPSRAVRRDKTTIILRAGDYNHLTPSFVKTREALQF